MPTLSHPLLDNPRQALEKRSKVVSAAEAVRLIRDGDTVATGGFVGIGFAENIAVALEKRFLGEDPQAEAGTPKNLTLFYAAGQGDGKSSPSRTGSRATTCRRASSATSSATSPAASRRRSRASGWAPSSTRATAAARSMRARRRISSRWSRSAARIT